MIDQRRKAAAGKRLDEPGHALAVRADQVIREQNVLGADVGKLDRVAAPGQSEEGARSPGMSRTMRALAVNGSIFVRGSCTRHCKRSTPPLPP